MEEAFFLFVPIQVCIHVHRNFMLFPTYRKLEISTFEFG